MRRGEGERRLWGGRLRRRARFGVGADEEQGWCGRSSRGSGCPAC